MNESTLKFIKCPKCNGIIDLEVYENKKEIIEGMLKWRRRRRRPRRWPRTDGRRSSASG